MIAYYPTVHFGSVTAETIRVVCVVPKRENSVLVRGMDIFLDTAQDPSPSDYWRVEVGTIAGQMSFTAYREYAAPFNGISRGRTEVAFQTPITYAVGGLVALRALPVGSPATLAGLQVTVRIEEP